MNVHYLPILCFCLLKKELEDGTFSSLKDFSLQSERYQVVCAKKLQNKSTLANIISEKFDACILNVSRSYNHSEDENKDLDKDLEFTPFITFMITLYALTIFVSILGNILLIIVMSFGVRSSFLDISPYLVNLGIFNLLM